MLRVNNLTGFGVRQGPPSTFDPLNKGLNTVLTFNNRDLSHTVTGQGPFTTARGTRGRNSGNYYFEFRFVTGANTSQTIMGLADATTANGAGLDNYIGNFSNSVGWRGRSAELFVSGFTTVAAPGAAVLTDSDTVSIAVSFTTNSVWYGYNGSWYGAVPQTGTTTGRAASFLGTPTLFPAASVQTDAQVLRLSTSASQFIHSPPSGFSAWG